MLALHGWLDNAATFATLAPRLRGFRILAIDLPGHGLSEHRPGEDGYHFIESLDEVAVLVAALGWRRYALLGHSMGAAIATLYSGALPEEVAAVVAIEALGPMTEEIAGTAERLSKHLRRVRLPTRKALPGYGTFDEAMAARVGAGDFSTPVVIRPVVERGLVQGEDGKWRWRSDRRLTVPSPIRLTIDQAAAILAAGTCPVLHLAASAGLEVSEEVKRAFAAAIGNRMQYHRINGGHHVHLEAPDEVAALTQAFLSGCLADGDWR